MSYHFPMKIFADTGSLKDIQAIADLGILDGVTTTGTRPGDLSP